MHIETRLVFLRAGFAVLTLCNNGLCGSGSSANLQKQFETIAKAAKGKVGVAVELLESRESVTLNAQEHFPMQSVYKLPIAMAALHQVDERKIKLEQPIEITTNDFAIGMHSPVRDAHPLGTTLTLSNLLQQMISASDGTACDVLLRLLNCPSAVDGYLRSLGLTNIVVATSEKEIGQDELAQYRNWATPEAFNVLLRRLSEGRDLSASSRQILLQFLTDTSTGPRRIKGLLPAGARVAHKTGTSQTVKGLTRATNDAGIISLPDGRHLVITVFISDSTADTATRDMVIAKVARAAWDHWVNLP